MIQWLKDLMQTHLVEDTPAGRSPNTAPQPKRVRAEQGETLAKQLALVIDLYVCVGCHACVT
jgi:hypothetical protein